MLRPLLYVALCARQVATLCVAPPSACVAFDSRATWTTAFCVEMPPWNATTQLNATELKLCAHRPHGTP
jgi:hypothetical protein